jgi:PPP family 3-phenylpropionic acid transporter
MHLFCYNTSTMNFKACDRMIFRSIKFNLLTIYFLAYGGLACYFPFLAVYFKSRGLTYIQSGIAFALISLISIIAQPIMGYIADKYLSKKQVVIINMLVCSALVYLYVIANSFYAIIFAIIALIFFQSSIMSIIDAYWVLLVLQWFQCF